MKKLRTEHFLVVLLVISLSAFLLAACDECKAPGCSGDGGGGDDTATISGKVLAITAAPPYPTVAGATVELEDGSISTTSGEDGSWTLEGVPVTADDPWIKITAEGYPLSFNGFPLSLGIVQYDLQVVDPALYGFFLGGADPETACLVFGAVVGFIDYDYPQEVQPLANATVSVTPNTLDVVYLNDIGFPDADLTETSSQGAFTVVVPDTDEITSISLTGTRPGSTLVGPPPIPTRPGAFVLAGLIDLLYSP